MSLTRSRTIQYLAIIALAFLAGGGYWYFSVRASTLNISPTNSLTSGLLGYWTLDAQDKSGSTITDRGSGGNNGTAFSVTASPGKVAQALSFNGTSAYVEIADSASLDITGSYSISLWFKAASFPGSDDNDLIAKYGNGACTWAMSVTRDNGVEQVYMQASKTSTCNYGADMAQRYTATTILPNTWYHVTGVYNASNQTIDMYVNGVLDNGLLQGTVPNSIVATNEVVNIGARGGQFFFDGRIDEVRLYNRVLSASEVESLYRLGESDKVNSAISQPQGTGRLESGLALYWPLDSSSGTTATDSSTNANNGTLTNMEDPGDWVTGRIGSALDFDGVNEYVTLADPASGVLDFADSTNFSLTGWFNRDTFTADHTIIAKSNGQTAADTGYNVYIDDATDKLTFVANDGTDQYKLESVSTFTATGWHHFAITWDDTGSSVTQLSIDGRAEAATATGTFANVNSLANALAFRVGAESDGGFPFDGKLDDIRVYHRALSADEISRLYRTTSPTNPETGLKGYWSFDGPTISGTTVRDLSGAGNHGTLTNGPTVRPGKIGQGMGFDNDNDYMATAGTPLTSSQKSVAAWIFPRTAGELNFGMIVSTFQTPSSNQGILFSMCSSDATECPATSNTIEVYQYFSGADGRWYVSGSNSIKLNEWNHVAFSYDSSSTTNDPLIYINGQLQTSVETQAPTGTRENDNSLLVGNQDTNAGSTFDGLIDEVRIYNRVLSASEITALYNQGR